jgi:hypothetical protein
VNPPFGWSKELFGRLEDAFGRLLELLGAKLFERFGPIVAEGGRLSFRCGLRSCEVRSGGG